MGRRKIKQKGAHKKKVRGHRQHRNLDAWHRDQTRRTLQEQARRRRMTRIDGESGEEYILSRLALRDKDDRDEYREGLDNAVAAADQTVEDQAAAIQAYLQEWVDEKRLLPIACHPKQKPACKVYTASKLVVVLRQDDPDAEV